MNWFFGHCKIHFIFILIILCLAISHYLSHLAHHLLILLVKSHLQLYPCPLQINYLWNLGFLLGISIIIQIITGIFLGLHYTSDLNSAYYSIFFFIREIYYGWYLRYFHSISRIHPITSPSCFTYIIIGYILN